MTKILTVFGATGQQGGSLIAYILEHPTLSTAYKLRGITRDTSRPAAIALKEKGVEVVKADIDDIGSLKEAVAGSYAVFSVTNFWEKASAAIEIAQGKAMADAAVAAGAELFIWSSLPNVTAMTHGKLTQVAHFDSKAEVETYVRGLPIKSVFYMAAFYMQNFLTMFKPRMNADGVPELAQTWNLDTELPLIDITDTGRFVAPALLEPEKYNGKRLTSATAYYTPKQLIEGWKTVTGKDVKYTQIPVGAARESSMTPEMLEVLNEVGGLLTEYHYFGPTGKKDLEWTLAQVEDPLTSWETFVRANGPWFEEA